MSTYEVEFKRVSYITITVEADSPEGAEDMGWAELQRSAYDDDDALWEVESIEEVAK